MKNIVGTIKSNLAKYIPISTDNSWERQLKKHRLMRAGAYTGLVVMALYVVAFVLPPITKDSTHAITGTSVASDTTLSISITNSALSLDLTPTSANGTFSTTSSPATIHVATNNITGYTLGIRASTSSDTASLLVNTIDECDSTPTSTKCSLSSLLNSVSPEDYSNNTATINGSSVDLNNTWGYLPSYYNSVSNTDYLPAPTTGDIINTTTGPNLPDTTNSTNNTSNNANTSNAADELVPDEYTINLGTRIDYTPYAGNYTNTFIVTAVGNPVPYSVSYDSNIPTPVQSTAEASNMPNAQVGEVSSGDTVAVLLSANTPTLGHTNPSTGQYEYAGYGFMGWCSEPTETIDDGTGNGYQACPTTATLYQPGDAFGIDQTAHNAQMLYAVWGYMTTITFNGNGATSGEPIDTIILKAGETITLPPNTYTRDGWFFVGWNTVQSPTEQDPGMSYEDQSAFTASTAFTEDITLYAQWRQPTLYDKVQELAKKDTDGNELMQSVTDLQAEITTPTTTDHALDTSNSGVYKYDPDTFGVSSDAANDYNIYYYRGILEPTADNGTYGSEGAATTYPNYVKLSNNTCWRIVRTTGSGGVKMIYNGVWDTTNNTCANATTKAQVTTSAFNGSYSNAIYVGYTYNNAMADNTDTATSVDTVFGNNTDTTLNNTRSTIKTYIEDTWYTSKMMTGSTDNYVDLLEPSAGYCNDRTAYDTSWNALTGIIPKQKVEIRFGAKKRVGANGNKVPSLTCPRGDVDLYRYISNTSATAFTSNELRYPAALLTADEASLAGSGYNGILPYNTKSFLNSGSFFLLLSPGYRISNGSVLGFRLRPGGYLDYYGLNSSNGVRPAISLKHDTAVISGSGTATDPWLINE